ncbi:hypothetical protein SAY86_031880 [Trapa natans]|uniref:Uncharacterized protein n=1 Tax=Trapa natans TaxID=22666 RepID=A0AAN7M406_TRANT|nr:hypothetical protein SAY86_031880 [Trapa natans]
MVKGSKVIGDESMRRISRSSTCQPQNSPKPLGEIHLKGDSLMRILNIAAFAVSGYSSTEGRCCKPFDPLLGKTYEADYPDKGLGQEKLPPTDSRLGPDQLYLVNGEFEMANAEKLRLEQRQLQDKGSNTFRYTGGYWEAREQGNWESCPNLFGQIPADQ